jgi:O-antigen/teichoic acid export membrane protein
MNDENSYKKILKITSVLGGVQVLQIMIQLVRSKLLALLIGVEGVGINSLFTSAINFINQSTSLGLQSSGVKSIAESKDNSDKYKLSVVLNSIKILCILTGILGTIVCLLFSGSLSFYTFGDYTQKFSFAILSIVFVLKQLYLEDLIILQGLRKIKDFAFANLIGLTIGLIISIWLLYKYNIDGIVPSILTMAFVNLIVSRIFRSRLDLPHLSTRLNDVINESKQIMPLGAILGLTSFVNLGSAYLLRILITKYGGLSEVGLYSSGSIIVTTYVGLVFTAMGTDYFPRLTSVVKDLKQFTKTVNQQIEMVLLALTPMLIALVIMSELVIKILYSDEFTEVVPFITFASIGVIFRGVSWSLGYVLISKGPSKTLLLSELCSIIYILFINVIMYKLYGIKGLGIAYSIGYFLHCIQMILINRIIYNIKIRPNVLRVLLVCITCTILSLLIKISDINIIFGFIILIISLIYSYWIIKSRIRKCN